MKLPEWLAPSLILSPTPASPNAGTAYGSQEKSKSKGFPSFGPRSISADKQDLD